VKETRLYEVTFLPVLAEGHYQIRLVEATGPRAAERHVAKLHVGNAELADGKRVAQLVTEGVKIEKAEE